MKAAVVLLHGRGASAEDIHLVLPAWLEPERARLEAVLPPLALPGVPAEAAP